MEELELLVLDMKLDNIEVIETQCNRNLDWNASSETQFRKDKDSDSGVVLANSDTID